MSDKKYYWLKLDKNFFKRHDIRIIENQKNGKDYILFYLKMLVESIDHEGGLRFNDMIPYDDDMLSIVTNTNIDIVRQAIKIFSQLQMIELLDDGTIYMAEVVRMTGSGAESTERVHKHRRKLKEIAQMPHVPQVENYKNNSMFGGNYYNVFKRDEQKCINCGKQDYLVVHHIIGLLPEIKESCDISSMAVLCKGCHAKEHANPYAIMTKVLLKSISFNMILHEFIATISNSRGKKQDAKNVTCNILKHLSNENETQSKSKSKRSEKDIDKDKDLKTLTCDFETFFSYYPTRNGGNSKKAAFDKWKARVKEGEKPDAMINGCIGYQKWCTASGNIGTKFVMQASRFLGADKHYLEKWEVTSGTNQQNRSTGNKIAECSAMFERVRQEIRDA